MRFLPDGTDIPDALIRAVIAGDAVFLCGAGVSLRSGMPSFKGLTEYVYTTLGETPANEAPEQKAFDREEYDRALRSLEKRTHPPGGLRSRVREVVSTRLRAPDAGEFPDHLALLKISKDSTGRSRLLTTNFDTLFERAAAEPGLSDVPSYAGKSLPKPGGPRDYGVLHLHGRIADPKLGLEETDLVLTSADFGDAYLRDGWASQYIEDRMRLAVLVLIGYRAEDAAFRLLLETLDADRDRFRDLQEIYTIEEGKADTASFWRAKGIKPVEFASYDAIYATLAEWAAFATRPTDYTRERLRTILIKSPDATSEFEREQVRFFLGMGNSAAILSEINPPLAWMPVLVEWKLFEFDDRRLLPWVERNLNEAQAVRDIVANINLLGPDTAEFLEYHLRDEEARLPQLLVQSWRLIIRHLRSAKRGLPRSEWFDLQPRIKRGDQSADALELLADLLRPKLTIGRRLSLHDEKATPSKSLSDLISIEYKVDGDVSVAEVLESWPRDSSAGVDNNLLNYLVGALDATLSDASDVGVESNEGYSASDFDVPSVAAHPQNEHRSGFLEITRVIAELWTRLTKKDPSRALQFLDRWRGSPFRLNHRLALYACADPVVPAEVAADALIGLPQGELFLTNTAVEVYRLLKARWSDFSPEKRSIIEKRLRGGPPRDWFREEAEIDKHIDWCRFDVLGQMKQAGFELGADTLTTITEIRERWPNWALKPEERAGFGVWVGSRDGVIGDPTKLQNVADDQIVAEAMRIDAAADFGEGDSWRALCLTEPDRALRGLEAEARAGRWSEKAWRPFFWERRTPGVPDEGARIARILLDCPKEEFGGIAGQACHWLTENYKVLGDDDQWKLWGKILVATSNELDEAGDRGDPLTRALNSPAGRLAELLLHKLRDEKEKGHLSRDLRERMDHLVAIPGSFGKLARVRLAAEVSLLFDLAPDWTAEKLVPLFEWSSPEASAMWSARSFSNFIGAPKLIGLMKAPFLELFGRTDTPPEQLRAYAQWLTTIALANQEHDAGYPIAMTEMRTALRRAGEKALPNVGHRLAVEMEKAPPDQKVARWRSAVGPVFQGIWPLDVELQTAASTFKLVQILRATGEAFPEAADVIIPFIRPERPGRHSAVYSIAKADQILFTSSPAKMLDLLSAVVGDPPPASVHALQQALARIQAADPKLADTRRFQKLRSCAAP
jgi:hypothetical protein